MANFIGSIFGMGSSKNSSVQGPSKNPQRVVRRIDVLGDKNIRQRLNEIHTFGKFDLKHQNGTVERAEIKKKDMAKIIAESELIGKTEAQIQRNLDTKHGFAAKTDTGEKVFYKLYGNTGLTKVRKEIGQAVIKERLPVGLSKKKIMNNVKLSRLIAKMAGGMKEEDNEEHTDWKNWREDKKNNPLKRVIKVPFSGKTAGQGIVSNSLGLSHVSGGQNYKNHSDGFANKPDHAVGVTGGNFKPKEGLVKSDNISIFNPPDPSKIRL